MKIQLLKLLRPVDTVARRMICGLLGHRYYGLKEFIDGYRKVGCRRCDCTWMMSDKHAAILAWDEEFREMANEFLDAMHTQNSEQTRQMLVPNAGKPSPVGDNTLSHKEALEWIVANYGHDGLAHAENVDCFKCVAEKALEVKADHPLISEKGQQALLDSWGDMVVILEALRWQNDEDPYLELGPSILESITEATDKARSVADLLDHGGIKRVFRARKNFSDSIREKVARGLSAGAISAQTRKEKKP